MTTTRLQKLWTAHRTKIIVIGVLVALSLCGLFVVPTVLKNVAGLPGIANLFRHEPAATQLTDDNTSGAPAEQPQATPVPTDIPAPTATIDPGQPPAVPQEDLVPPADLSPSWTELGTNESSNPVFPDWRDTSKAQIAHVVTDNGETITTVHSDAGVVTLVRGGQTIWQHSFKGNQGMFVVLNVKAGDVVWVATKSVNNGHFSMSANAGFCNNVEILTCANAWFGRIEGQSLPNMDAIADAHLIFGEDSRTTQDPKPWAVYVDIEGHETVITHP